MTEEKHDANQPTPEETPSTTSNENPASSENTAEIPVVDNPESTDETTAEAAAYGTINHPHEKHHGRPGHKENASHAGHMHQSGTGTASANAEAPTAQRVFALVGMIAGIFIFVFGIGMFMFYTPGDTLMYSYGRGADVATIASTAEVLKFGFAFTLMGFGATTFAHFGMHLRDK